MINPILNNFKWRFTQSGKIYFNCFKTVIFSNDLIDEVILLIEQLGIDENSYILRKQSEVILPDKLEPDDIKHETFSIPVIIKWTLYFKNSSDWVAFQLIY